MSTFGAIAFGIVLVAFVLAVIVGFVYALHFWAGKARTDGGVAFRAMVVLLGACGAIALFAGTCISLGIG